MRCPSLKDLSAPASSETKAGWPWTEENPCLADKMLNGCLWPRISVVTPSYNQGRFLEETIRSVLLQGYPNLEYIIIDGGSTDGSVDIIRKYARWLKYWVSQPDKGQTGAINQGFKRTTGDIITWLNSDDFYCQQTLAAVANQFCQSKKTSFIYGDCSLITAEGRFIENIYSKRYKKGRKSGRYFLNFIVQPSVFIRRLVIEQIGYLDENLRFAMDHDFWLRILTNNRFSALYLPVVLSMFRIHKNSLTEKAGPTCLMEDFFLIRKYDPQNFGYFAKLHLLHYAKNNRYPLEKLFSTVVEKVSQDNNLKDILKDLEKIKSYIMAKSYLQKACVEYNNLNLMMARKYLIEAAKVRRGAVYSREFIGLLSKTYIPRGLIKYLRRYARDDY